MLRLFIAVRESISNNGKQKHELTEQNEIQFMFATWEDLVTKMAESEKVYNTLLKTRYALENNLISIGKCNKECN